MSVEADIAMILRGSPAPEMIAIERRAAGLFTRRAALQAERAALEKPPAAAARRKAAITTHQDEPKTCQKRDSGHSEFNDDRRVKAGVPDDLHHVEKWRLALQMIDELTGWGLTPGVILADGAYGDNTQFRQGLEDRGCSYVLDTKAGTSADAQDAEPEQPEYQGRGQPPRRRYREAPLSLKDLALGAGQEDAVKVKWREGTRGEMTSRFIALRVRPADIELSRKAQKNAEELTLV